MTISISKSAGAVSRAVNFLVTENITCFYFEQMLFSCSESHYFEIQGKTATWLPKFLDKFQCHEICNSLALTFHFWLLNTEHNQSNI